MKCPLQEVGVYKDKGTSSQEYYWEPRDCLEAGCVWWDPANKCCAIRTIVSVLGRLTKKAGEGL